MTHQRTSKNLLGVAGGIILVLLLAAASLFLGSKSIDASRVWEVLLHADGSFESTVVRDQRIPRTILVILVAWRSAWRARSCSRSPATR